MSTKTQTLSTRVVNQDRTLATGINKSGFTLCKLRWHWTRDESNPKRVSIADYAMAVDRTNQAIAGSVEAHLIHLDQPELSYTDCMVLAHMSEETQVAAEAVAYEHDTSIANAAKKHRKQVKEVKKEVRKGKSPEAAASLVAVREARHKASVTGRLISALGQVKYEMMAIMGVTIPEAELPALEEAMDETFSMAGIFRRNVKRQAA